MGKTARDRRTYDRAKENGWTKLSKASRQYRNWVKSLRNTQAYDEFGFMYYAWNREPLIKNGGKP